MQEKVVLITGGGRGIGAACAQLFAQNGYHVAITSRSSEELDQVKKQCVDSLHTGKKIVSYIADLNHIEEIKSLFQRIDDDFGCVTTLVNNAGFIVVKSLLETQVEDWDQTINVNLKASYFCCQQAFLRMEKTQTPCSIVNISSLGGIAGTEKFPGFSSYSISKFGVVGMTEALAVEGKPLGIRVNCVAPGAVDTKMLKEAAPFLSTTTKPMDIAKVISGLCDEELYGAVTGATIPVYSNNS